MTTFAISSVFIFFYVWEAALFFSDLYLLHISDWKGNKPRKLLQYPTIFSNVQKSYNILTTYHALKLFSQPTPGPKQFVHCFSPQNVLDPIFFRVWVLPFPSWPDPIFLTPSSSLACCRMGSSRLCIMLLWCRVCVCVCGHGCPLCIYVYINCIFKWFGPLRGGGGRRERGRCLKGSGISILFWEFSFSKHLLLSPCSLCLQLTHFFSMLDECGFLEFSTEYSRINFYKL